MRVLVTGGAGFIGSHVVDRLHAHGLEPRIFDLVAPPYGAARHIETVTGSVTDSDALARAMSGCDAVIHLAAVADVADVRDAPALAEHVNTRGTLNVLEAARHVGVRRVLFGSTTWVYSDCADERVDEDTVIAAPTHLYTATKLAGETYCEAYAQLYGLEHTILRFGIPYGPRAREAGVVPAFVGRALAGEPLVLAGGGLQFRNFVYVEDLAEGVVLALRPAAVNRIYNLAAPDVCTIREVAEAVREVVGAGEIVLGEPRPGDFFGKRVISERAGHELGWTASTPLGAGIRRYLGWRLARPNGHVVAAQSNALSAPAARMLILSADIGEGHDLPARALAADLAAERPGSEITVMNGLAAMGWLLPRVLRDGSAVLFRWMPWVFSVQYWLVTRFRPTRWLGERLLYLLGSRPLLRLIRAHDPDVVVSTYPGITAVLGMLRLRRRLSTPVVSVITDLAGLLYWAHPGVDLHTVTHPESIEEVERIAGPGSVRWARPPTSSGFLAARAQTDARRALGLPTDGKVVVVSGGGWGVGDLDGAIRAALEIEAATVVCVTGRNDRVRRRLEQAFGSEPRVRILGFTDRMSDLLASADALVHSTAGLTVLEAIIRGCPVISYGFAVGHVRVNDRALRRFGLATPASSRRRLSTALARALQQRGDPDPSFAAQPSVAALTLTAGPRVVRRPIWRLRAARVAIAATAALVVGSLSVTAGGSYQFVTKMLELRPVTAVSTTVPQVGLLIDASPRVAAGVARELARHRARASFALWQVPTPAAIGSIRAAGDEMLPMLRSGDPVRWLGTKHQLGRTARALGLPRHFFYVAPREGFTIGQYLLARTSGGSPIASATRLNAGEPAGSIRAGEVVELTLADRPLRDAARALDGLVADLRRHGFRPVAVGQLMRGGVK